MSGLPGGSRRQLRRNNPRPFQDAGLDMDSSSPATSPSQPLRQTPHVRLNSGTSNILNSMPDGSQFRSTRSLTKGKARLPMTSKRSREGMYRNAMIAGSSSEQLLPPPNPLPRHARDADSRQMSPLSPASSRRSTLDSAGEPSSDNPNDHWRSPFRDPSPSVGESDDDNFNTMTVSERYNILPTSGLLLYPEDVEKDDWLHNPNDDDGVGCDACSLRGLINVGGLALITIGIMVLFIGYPILTYIQKILAEKQHCERDPMCISYGELPLLKNVKRSLIDPDTPKSAMTRKSTGGKKQRLVFSDEFNKEGRTFYNEDDPYFQAVDIWYGVTYDLEWYDPDAVTTENGTLVIRFDAFRNHNLEYRSGMIQSWNKMCFKGGYIEVSTSLPGRGDTIGFWPGIWTMGNLGRPGYPSTTEGMWPYSYEDLCDPGITPNQSDPGGLSFLPGMKLPACTCIGEDHPTPGRSRSAPEIDVLEASVEFLDHPERNGVGSASQSIQCAPFDVFWRPNYDFVEVYDDTITVMNQYQGSHWQEAASGLTNLNNHWYRGEEYQKYAFEYTPGKKGKVTWWVGDDKTWMIDGRAFGPNGNIGHRIIPEEPMSVVVNFGMSNAFAFLNMSGLEPLIPATMRIDYIRIYQDEGEELVTCDPPGWETTEYIARHPEPYSNPNLTLWSETPYDWPRNSLMHGCKAQNYEEPKKSKSSKGS